MRLAREMAEAGERRAACAAPVVIRHAAAAAMARTIRNARIFRSSSQRPAARRGRVRSFEAARSTVSAVFAPLIFRVRRIFGCEILPRDSHVSGGIRR
jgi:hypothetical protein